MYLHIQSADVIRLIQQFLKEQNLFKTFQCLQEESGVEFNAVNDPQKLEEDILNGKWSLVLETIKTVQLPKDKLMDLYEHLLVELSEIGDVETALQVLKHSPTMSMLKKEYTSRISKLHRAMTKFPFETIEYYTNSAEKQKRRATISNEILEEVYTVQSSRLLVLLNQSLKWQQFIGALPRGSKLDLLRNCPLNEKKAKEKIISKLICQIKFGDAETLAECCEFSPDGQLLVTGTVDGFAEIWDYETGKLRKDIKYQAEDEFMIHSAPIFCLAFSKDSEKLAVGGKDGQIKVFRLSDGECIELFKDAHSASVTSIDFSNDGGQFVSSSLDFTAKVHGFRTNATLKVFNGHKSFVNKALFCSTNKVITASSDGTVKIWDVRDANCVKTITPNKDRSIEVSVISVILFPHKADLFFVCSKSDSIKLMKFDGKVVKTFNLPPQQNSDNVQFVSCAVSALSNLLYAVDENKVLYCFSVETGKLMNAIKMHEKNVLGIIHHPHLNFLVSFSLDATLRIWGAKT